MKPRLRIINGQWTCGTREFRAHGATPDEAFNHWQSFIAFCLSMVVAE